MGIEIGQFGQIEAKEDFTGSVDSTAMATVATGIGSRQWAYVSVNEGTFDQTTDEPGGILAVTNDTDDNSNCFLYTGPFKPADGGVVMEARLKMLNTITTNMAAFVGFSETLNEATPVMPSEMSGSTVVYNGSGGMVGLMYDADATTKDWRAVAGDAGAVSSNADANGTAAGEAPVADEWDVVRVEIGPSGKGEVYLNGRKIKSIASAITTTDNFFACLGVENRSNVSTGVFEVDYAYARGGRDWNAT